MQTIACGVAQKWVARELSIGIAFPRGEAKSEIGRIFYDEPCAAGAQAGSNRQPTDGRGVASRRPCDMGAFSKVWPDRFSGNSALSDLAIGYW